MSRFDVERFTTAMQRDQELEEKFLSRQDDPVALAQWAKSEGYELTAEEVEGLISSYGELPMEELENVAGGWDGG